MSLTIANLLVLALLAASLIALGFVLINYLKSDKILAEFKTKVEQSDLQLAALAQEKLQFKNLIDAQNAEHTNLVAENRKLAADNLRLGGENSQQKEEIAQKLGQISKLIQDNASLGGRLERYQALQEELVKKNHLLDELSSNLGTLKEERALLKSKLEALQELHRELLKRYDELEPKRNEVDELVKRNAALKSQLEAQQALQEELQKRFASGREDLEKQFKLAAEQMVKTGTEDLNKSSKEKFEQAVSPLKEELATFRKLLVETQTCNSKQAGEISKELKQLESAHLVLSKQAEDLSKALKSGGKSQGMWGELQLERVLDASGLTRGLEYEREVAGVKALGERGRPDAVVNLPGNHCLIIDAKCSLTDYTAFINADNDKAKENAIKRHLLSVKSHVDELKNKDYSSYKSLNSPLFVFMFVPIDGALEAALSYDSALYDYASRNKVYLVSPSSILPALRVVANLWVLSNQNDKVRDLVSEANDIASKFDLVLEAIENVDKAEISLKKNLDTLKNRLCDGRGNLKNRICNFAQSAPKVIKQLDGLTIDQDAKVSNLEVISAPSNDPLKPQGAGADRS